MSFEMDLHNPTADVPLDIFDDFDFDCLLNTYIQDLPEVVTMVNPAREVVTTVNPAQECPSVDTGSQDVKSNVVPFDMTEQFQLLAQFEKGSSGKDEPGSSGKDEIHGRSQSQPVSRTCSARNSPILDPPKAPAPDLLFHEMSERWTMPVSLSVKQKTTQPQCYNKLPCKSESPLQVEPFAQTEPQGIWKNLHSNLVSQSLFSTCGTNKSNQVVKNIGCLQKTAAVTSDSSQSYQKNMAMGSTSISVSRPPALVQKKVTSGTSQSAEKKTHFGLSDQDLKRSQKIAAARLMGGVGKLEGVSLINRERVRWGNEKLVSEGSCITNRCLENYAASKCLRKSAAVTPATSQTGQKNMAMGSTSTSISQPPAPVQEKVTSETLKSAEKNFAMDSAITSNEAEMSAEIVLQAAENLTKCVGRESVLDHDYVLICPRRIIVDYHDLVDSPTKSIVQMQSKNAESQGQEPAKRAVTKLDLVSTSVHSVKIENTSVIQVDQEGIFIPSHPKNTSVTSKVNQPQNASIASQVTQPQSCYTASQVNYPQNTVDFKVNPILRTPASQFNQAHGTAVVSQVKLSANSSFAQMAASSSSTLATNSSNTDSVVNSSVSNQTELPITTIITNRNVCAENTLPIPDISHRMCNDFENDGSSPEDEFKGENVKVVHDTSFSQTENLHENSTTESRTSWEEIQEEQLSRLIPWLRTCEDTTDSGPLAKQAKLCTAKNVSQSDLGLSNAKLGNSSHNIKDWRPENCLSQEAKSDCFSKIPPYISELSIPKQSGRKELRADDIESNTTHDFIPVDPTSCGKQQESGIDKLPSYLTCESNRVKYDEAVCVELKAAEDASSSPSTPPVHSDRPSRSSRSRDRRSRARRKHSVSSGSPRSRSRSRSPRHSRQLSSESSYSSDTSGSHSRSQDFARFRSRSRSRSRLRNHSQYDYPKRARIEQRQRNRDRKEGEDRKMVDRQVVYVGKIDKSFTHEKLRKIFSPYGKIDRVSTYFREAQDSYGFVYFRNASSASKAIDNANKDTKYSFDLCYGERRKFCRSEYLDLDGNRAREEEYMIEQPRSEKSYAELLQQAIAAQKKSGRTG